jgi:putative spermidine/putrescine transport system substrate-binding protein
MTRKHVRSTSPDAAGGGPVPRLTRRTVLRGAATAAAALAAPYLGSSSARAQGKEIVIPMSGGSFMSNWQSDVVDPFRRKTGINVKMVPGNMKTHAMSLLASRGNPPFDAFIGNGDDFVKLIDSGRMLKLTPDKVPSVQDFHPKFKEQWDGYGALFDYFSIGLAYNRDQLKDPPKSWREFVERTAKGEFGRTVFFNSLTAGVRGPEVLVTLSKALSGSEQSVDAGFEALRRMKPNIFKFFGSINDPIVMLLNGEGVIGPSWDGRTFVAHDESNGKIQFIKPAEGLASNGPPIGVVKGGNEEAGYALVDFALSAEVQQAFCEKMYYGSGNSKVVYSPKLAGRIPTPDEVSVPNERYMVANIGSWIERWNREIVG